MTSTISVVDPRLLLAHERWAARLARALVHDDDLAQDIVQEARVSFWRRGAFFLVFRLTRSGSFFPPVSRFHSSKVWGEIFP
jgi:DNA-directed RNA polymerase specialized sigma24 family protein